MVRGSSQKVLRRGLVKGWESSQDEIMSNVKVILIQETSRWLKKYKVLCA